MGYTYINLERNRRTLSQAKENHVREATRYGGQIIATIVMHEWHEKTWYAIIRLEDQSDGKVIYFFRTDIIDTSGGEFGYKSMEEGMGPYLENRPSSAMARAVFKYIPEAPLYAADFRDRAGISYMKKAA